MPAVALLLGACVQHLPDAAAMDEYYRKAEALCQEERADINRRHASGEIDDATYKQELAALDGRIAKRATDFAIATQQIDEARREGQGLPSPDHPVAISVPEAGSLPTGTSYRQFNKQQDAVYGGSGETVNSMRQMMNQYQPGQNIRTPTSGR